jgi:type IV pilus assembly protein PilY1
MIACKRILPLLLGALFATMTSADPLTISQYPLFLTHKTLPNVLVIYDNSESMDGTMAGKLIAGDDPTTRGNIARSVIRNTVNMFSGQFNWGLETFNIGGAGLYSTYPYWLGNETTMVFTDDCVNGVSVSNAGLRCIANPQWQLGSVGDQFVTYDRASDDPDINDVLYIGYFGSGAWATTAGGGSYHFYFTHNPGTDFEANMANYWTDLSFTPTDAGYIPYNPPISRQIYVYRAWGFYAGVYGNGIVQEPIQPSGTAGHMSNLMTLLATETQSGPDVKNAAVFTPLAGSMSTASQYFQGSAGYPSPITLACQRSFVLLATDGNPTSDMNGNMYPLSSQVNTYNAGSQTWTFSQAVNDVLPQISGLRSLSVSNATHDIQTYVVGLGDTVANPGSVATLNQFAATGGTNQAYLANDASSLASAFQAIAVDIESKTAAASAVSLNTGSWGTGTNLYQARFNSGDWSGQLISYAVNQDGTIGSQLWDAGQVINGQNWDTGRAILTYKPSASLGARGVAFRWPSTYPTTPTSSEMDLAQSSLLNADSAGNVDGFGSQRVAWIRGSADNESGACGTCTPTFRSRPASKLGDIVHSAPTYVAAPSFGYPDSMESAAYSSFAVAKANRTPMIYVGANDGMLHAFNASTGIEAMAYVPSPVYRNLSALTTQSLSSGAGEPTSHHYQVDGSPTIGDVFYAGGWHTLLAGAMAGGGQGIYVLDVTNPGTFSQTSAGAVVRWEFNDTSDPDMGYVFGQPLLLKTNDGKWSVVFGNGYNNTETDGNASATGHAVLYVVDAETGVLTAKIDTMTGTATAPDGLSGAIGVDTNGDGIVDSVYAGDLTGNLWKFDLSSASPSSWAVAFAGAPLFNTGGKPITVRPDVTRFTQGGYLITFGTGRYIDPSDIGNTDVQTFYGIRDTSAPVSGLSNLVHQVVVGTATGADSNTYRLTTHAVGPATLDAALSGDNVISTAAYNSSKKGWYLDLPTAGERNVTDPTIRAGRVVFNTLIPNSDPCGFGGNGWVMEVDVMTGNRYDTPTFDTDGDGQITNADMVTSNGSADNTSGRMMSSIPAAAGFLRAPGPRAKPYENKYVNTSSGAVNVVGETAGLGDLGRKSWRQIQ